MKRIIFSFALCIILGTSINALEIINSKGVSKQYSNAELHKLETQELKTSREKDGQIRLGNWQGFRFDKWLEKQNLGEFTNIRFESPDRYLVNLSLEEYSTRETWLVIAKDGAHFDNNSLRLIIPSMREMYWISDLKRVVLENFVPLPTPKRFYLMKPFLDTQKLHKNPKPFVKIEGWLFNELLPKLSESPTNKVILYSRDGLKQNLEFPLHLEGAVLEKTKDDTYNLKSPQIPGGMWIRDIVYLQCDSQALISKSSLNSLIDFAKLFGWENNPDLKFRIVKKGSEEILNFGDALAEPQVFNGAEYFELF